MLSPRALRPSFDSEPSEVFGEKRKAFDSAAARLNDIDDSKAAELIANAKKIEKEKERAVNGRSAALLAGSGLCKVSLWA